MANAGENGDESTPRPIVHISDEARGIANLAVAFTSIGSRLYDCARLLDEASGDKRMVILAQLASELTELREAVVDAKIAMNAARGGMR